MSNASVGFPLGFLNLLLAVEWKLADMVGSVMGWWG